MPQESSQNLQQGHDYEDGCNGGVRVTYANHGYGASTDYTSMTALINHNKKVTRVTRKKRERNYRGKSFRKGDFDPRTTVTVKKKYSEGREALEDIKTESNPRSDTTDNLSETPRRSSNAANSV